MFPKPAYHPFVDYVAPVLLVAMLKILFPDHPYHLNWGWPQLTYLLLAWLVLTLVWRYWWKAPSKVWIAAYPTPLGRWLTALRMTFDSETLLQRAYDKSNGKPFAIPMTDRWIVFISDREQLQSLEREPEYVLSMEKALHELALTEPILGHLQVPPELKGPKSEAFRVMVGVLKNKLRSAIPGLSNSFHTRIKEAVALETTPATVTSRGNDRSPDWTPVRLMPALLRIFTRLNLLVFMGEEEGGRPEVYQEFMDFFWTCALAFPVLSLAPSFLTPLIAPVAMGMGITRSRVFQRILRFTRQALEDKHEGGKNEQSGNLTKWTAEMTKLHDAVQIAKVTIGLLFASAFQVPMIVQFCIYRLCKHQECFDKLRAEALDSKDITFGTLNEEMPYLDSFVKETARLSPGPVVSAPRTGLLPYTLDDGCHVPTGNWLAIPQLPFMRDESVWKGGKDFQGFRFVDENSGTSQSRFTHPSYEYPFWGSIKHACPARFYVSMAMKTILSHLLVEYEFKLADAQAEPFLTFGKVRLPNPFMTLLVRKRVE